MCALQPPPQKGGLQGRVQNLLNQRRLGKNHDDKPAIFSKSTQEPDEPILQRLDWGKWKFIKFPKF
jgi:hypothetical protein